MPKKESLQDMVVKKSIREIPILESRRGKLPLEFRQEILTETTKVVSKKKAEETFQDDPLGETDKKKNFLPRWFSRKVFPLVAGTLFFAGVLFLLIGGSFAEATITVKVKHDDVSVANIFTFQRKRSARSLFIIPTVANRSGSSKILDLKRLMD